MQPISSTIEKWLLLRQELMASLQQLCLLRPFYMHSQDLITTSLQEFCQHLIDYLAMGHFKAFEQLIPQPLMTMSWQVLPKFLDFNDKYQDTHHLLSLEKDLSVVVLNLAWQFDVEDRLVQQYLGEEPHIQSIAKIA